MSTSLHCISNINTTRKEVYDNKDAYLKKLKALNLEHMYTQRYNDKGHFMGFEKAVGDWDYEIPLDLEGNVNNNAAEIIYFEGPYMFSISVYHQCLEISTMYNYSYLYSKANPDSIYEFRKEIFKMISIFGGTEIICLADNACDKLSEYLELQVWEGVSYNDVKNDMLKKGLPFVSDYDNLNIDMLSYADIKEIVFDDFSDLKVD